MLKAKNINMLEGPLFKNIVFYTIPIIVTNLLQLLFNAADIIVVGRFCGSIAVAAVGSNGSLVNLLINIMLGLSVGTGILTAQNLGANDNTAVKQIIHTAIPTAFILGAFLSVFGFFFSGKLLTLMDTPADVLPLATVYLKIYFCGVLSLSIYNFGASILRAAGDTKSPLIFLSISGVLNVVLNLIFVIVFDMSVAGVALATTISQTLSAVLVIIKLINRNDACRLELRQLKIHKTMLFKIMRIGIPACIQSSMYSISNVIIQSSINSFGAVVVSGNASAANIEGFIYTSMNAFHQTALNFTGQNVGAGNYKRVKKILIVCICCAGTVGLILGSACYIFGRPLLSIYITDSAAAIEAGLVRLSYIGLLYFLCGMMDAISGSIRGLGASISPMIISILGACVFRVGWIYTVFQIPAFHTADTLYMSYSISWVIIATGLLIAYSIIYKKFKRQQENKLKEQRIEK